MKDLDEPIAGTLLDGEVTGAIIRLFFRVYDRLGFGYRLEVGLLLHFGPKARFHRLIYTNDHKRSVRDPS